MAIAVRLIVEYSHRPVEQTLCILGTVGDAGHSEFAIL